MQVCGNALAAVGGMLITSAVAMFFSCSGATDFSVFKFDSVGSVFRWERQTCRSNLRFETCSSAPASRLDA
jgi:hypothetical protein